MPRSRKSRKNQEKPQWGKNNPQTKAKNRKMIITIGIIAVAAVAIAALVMLAPNGLFSTAPSSSPSPSPSSSTAPSPVYLPAGVTPLTSPTGEYSSSGTIILFQTSMGNITIQMRDDKPITTSNFESITQQGLYDGTIFHRVIAGFMIQGGAVSSSAAHNIVDEIGNDNVNYNGTIAMANTGAANSASSQFFINVANNGNNVIDQQGTKFDTKYTVFGQVIGGMDIVMKISQISVTANPMGENSQPIQTITLQHAYIVTH
jgi:cyclophilin family peptidyl-prolyl cis-trans isomerase